MVSSNHGLGRLLTCVKEFSGWLMVRRMATGGAGVSFRSANHDEGFGHLWVRRERESQSLRPLLPLQFHHSYFSAFSPEFQSTCKWGWSSWIISRARIHKMSYQIVLKADLAMMMLFISAAHNSGCTQRHLLTIYRGKHLGGDIPLFWDDLRRY